jgi:hypothetical protein
MTRRTQGERRLGAGPRLQEAGDDDSELESSETDVSTTVEAVSDDDSLGNEIWVERPLVPVQHPEVLKF